VVPLDDRLSFYVSIQRAQDGSLTAFIRNLQALDLVLFPLGDLKRHVDLRLMILDIRLDLHLRESRLPIDGKIATALGS